MNRTEALTFVLARGWSPAEAAAILGRRRKFSEQQLIADIRQYAGYSDRKAAQADRELVSA